MTRIRGADRQAGSKYQRDLFYGQRRWKRLRQWFLRRNPLCVDCKARDDSITLATQVDHIISRVHRPDLELSYDNLRALCHSCHSRRTRALQEQP